jgi:hypothetical protein
MGAAWVKAPKSYGRRAAAYGATSSSGRLTAKDCSPVNWLAKRVHRGFWCRQEAGLETSHIPYRGTHPHHPGRPCFVPLRPPCLGRCWFSTSCPTQTRSPSLPNPSRRHHCALCAHSHRTVCTAAIGGPWPTCLARARPWRSVSRSAAFVGNRQPMTAV